MQAFSEIIQDIYQALFLVSILTTLFWGTGLHQFYTYLKTFYSEDTWKLKGYTLLMWSLDSVQQVAIIRYGYRVFVRGAEENIIPQLFQSDWGELPLISLSADLVELIVQLFYVRRIWTLSNGSIPLLSIVLIFVVGQQVIFLRLFSEILIAATEILLATVIAVLLHFGYQGLGFKKINSIIDKLVRYTICSGAVTAISAIAALISISAFPKSTIHIVFGSLKAKMYMNAMLALLNSRSSIRARGKTKSETDINSTPGFNRNTISVPVDRCIL
ncbi:hypothetical protein PNOK_0883600 [Pyrrhoderma noxium]|uniref:DUF6534 domain-containing protein n=1 Tax=Pyrrhoderma noxium TaxID=2282107 RepID=A0A286U8S5_9AGAM|nr:hypothetical protein PNOK_0883600 [Pyrrhoderma noxium]